MAINDWPIASEDRDRRDPAKVTKRLIGWRPLLVLLACLTSTPAFAACSVKKPADADLGTYSPAAVRQTVVPYKPASSGFGCTTALLSLGGDTARLRVSSAQGFKLTSTTETTKSVSYTLAADAAGTRPITAANTFVYGSGPNVIGLLGDVSDVKIYIRPESAETMPAGIYKGDFTVAWTWDFCSLIGVGLGGVLVCVLSDTNTSSTNTATVSVTLTLTANPVQMVIATRTVWDPQYNTSNPRATPGSRQRTTVTVTNPDIAAIDVDSLKIVIPTPVRGVVALDGDKTPTNAVVTTTDGTPTSNLAVTYTASNNNGDDVEFSNNTTFASDTEPWSYQPAPGSAAAQAAITAIRFKPRGIMAAQSSFSVSMPYSVSETKP
jgi:hypothetical protein